MELYDAIKKLCPDMGRKEVRRAMRILEGAPLLPHGSIPKANYKLKPVTHNDDRYEAVYAVSFAMLWRCFNFGDNFAAIASTQVGITFPIIVFAGSETFVQHPRCKGLRSKPTVFLEGCGSLPNEAVYFASFPGRVDITFYQLEGEREQYRNLDVGSWFKLNWIGSSNGVNIANFIHEFQHLQGLTAANNGWLLHPRNVPSHIWRGYRQNFVNVMKPEYRDGVLMILGRFKPGNDDLELQGKRALWAYLHVWKAKVPGAKLLLPTACYDPRPYKVVSVADYAKEIGKLF